MAFLELTTGTPTALDSRCLVNIGNITDIHEKTGGGCTLYFNGDQNSVFVKETFEELRQLIELTSL